MKSRDQIGKAGSKDLLEYYISQFGAVDSTGFKCAQRAFIESMAGYAVVCFLLNIKVNSHLNIKNDKNNNNDNNNKRGIKSNSNYSDSVNTHQLVQINILPKTFRPICHHILDKGKKKLSPTHS